MEPRSDRNYTAFAGTKKLANGPVMEVAVKVKKHLKAEGKNDVLIFDDLTGEQIEIDFRGDLGDVKARIEALVEAQAGKRTGPGRPRLGVLAKEVTLLPEHWEWLAIQTGGASVTLRRLVEEARKKNTSRDQVRLAQERVYKFMTVMGGNLAGYEEALRSLYKGDLKSFKACIMEWPKDIQEQVLRMSRDAF